MKNLGDIRMFIVEKVVINLVDCYLIAANSIRKAITTVLITSFITDILFITNIKINIISQILNEYSYLSLLIIGEIK